MEKEFIQIVAVIDESGSMSPNKESVISGFNEFLQTQKKDDDKILMDAVLFNTNFKTIIENEDVKNIKLLDNDSYNPDGCTALNDAVGNSIKTIEKRYKDAKIAPKKVIYLIITDGMENASSEYSKQALAKIIKEKQDKDGWVFSYQGANIDSFSEASSIGIRPDNVCNFVPNSTGIKYCFKMFASVVKDNK